MIDGSSTNLSIKACVDSNVLILQFVGTIDIHSADALTEIIHILEQKKVGAVLIDLSAVSDIDTAGMDHLAQFGNRLVQMGGAIRLYQLKPEIGKRLRNLKLSHRLPKARSWKGGLSDIKEEADPARLIPSSRVSEVTGALYTVLHPPRKPMAAEILKDRDWLQAGPSPGLHISTTTGNRQYYFYTSIASYNQDELVVFRTESKVPIDPGQIVVADFDNPDGRHQFQTEIIALGKMQLADGISVSLIHLIFPEIVSRRQNRYSSRISTNLSADFKDIDPEGGGGTYQGVITDLSGGGCLLSASRDLPELTFIKLSFQLPDGATIGNITGRVNFLTRSDIGDSQLRIQFIMFDPEDRDRILQYIYLTQLEPSDLIV